MQKKNIQLVNFEPWHLRRLCLRPEDAADLKGIERAELAASWQGGRSILLNGVPAFIYGYAANGGVVGIYALSSALADKIPLLLTRLARAFIRDSFRSGAHRIEAYCHADNLRSLHWLTRSLGMRIEGLLRKSGPNAQDRVILSLVQEDLEVLRWAVL